MTEDKKSRVKPSEKKRSKLAIAVKILLPILFIAVGAVAWDYFKSSKVKVKRKPRKPPMTAVKTIQAQPGSFHAWVDAMGTVTPEKEITLKSKISGEVVAVSDRFVHGGVVKKGERLLQVDDTDYRIAVKKAQIILDKALAGLELEKGSQEIAREEFQMMNRAEMRINGSDAKIEAGSLALREPQLKQAQAEVANAKADLEKARLNLSRTKIVAPFNALILEKKIDAGGVISTQDVLAVLVDVNHYKIEAKVPQDKLAAILQKAENSAEAIIQSNYSNQTWQGKMVRTTGKVVENTRMAGVIIQVPDPLNLTGKSKPGTVMQNRKLQLLLNDHVNIKIKGPEMKQVFSLARQLIRENNTVWIFTSGTLDIRTVEIVWKDDTHVFVRNGIEKGEHIITTDLPVAVSGMKLALASGKKPGRKMGKVPAKEPGKGQQKRPGKGSEKGPEQS